MATNYENGRNDVVDVLGLSFVFKFSTYGRKRSTFLSRDSYIFFPHPGCDFEEGCVLGGRISLLARLIFYNHETSWVLVEILILICPKTWVERCDNYRLKETAGNMCLRKKHWKSLLTQKILKSVHCGCSTSLFNEWVEKPGRVKSEQELSIFTFVTSHIQL